MRFLNVLILILSISVVLVSTQHETDSQKVDADAPPNDGEEEVFMERPEDELKKFRATPPEDNEKLDGLPPRITEADHDRIQKILKEFPSLPKDTFTIKETSFRKKYTPEELEEMKKKREEKRRRDNQPLYDMIKERMSRHQEIVDGMTPEEAEILVHKIEKEQEEELAKDKQAQKDEL